MKHSNTSPSVVQVETIYRAKTIKQDFETETKSLKKINGVWYCIGDLRKIASEFFIQFGLENINKIDQSTRAIHFTNSGMNDSEGAPIFASLSSDGNGSDKFDFEIYCSIEGWYHEKGLLTWDSEELAFMVHCEYENEVKLYNINEMPIFKVTGIHTVKEEQ